MSTPSRILVVDDEADLRELLELTLLRLGHDVDCCADVAEACKRLESEDYALVITDMRLPDGSGLDVLTVAQQRQPGVPVTVITAFGSTDNAIAALKAGAFDYLSKPVELDRLRTMVRAALGGTAAAPATAAGGATPLLLGESAAMQRVRALIERLARSMAPVAISGESGSGKELAARLIHQQSSRRQQPFIAVNCGALPETLMESEFFGYRKGAFTGAEADRDGFFQAANGGTLMLDEVAELPLTMQVKLLRVIQERRVRKVGSTVEEPVDVRIISATHHNLTELVAQGRFRQDLYYRLNVLELALPPLRERSEDIPLLARALLERQTPAGQTAPQLAPSALAALLQHPFPGNVRELENVLERARALCSDAVITADDLGLSRGAGMRTPGIDTGLETGGIQPALPALELPGSLEQYLDAIEKDILIQTLQRTHGNRTRAADLLGLNLRQIRYRLQRLGVGG
jgi:two-component system response regulator PilR (NtrC family)